MRANAAATLLLIGSTHSPSTVLAGTARPRSPLLPRWQPSWHMNQSTIIMTCNQSGYTTAANVSKFAIVDYDVCPATATAAAVVSASAASAADRFFLCMQWNNAKEIWANSPGEVMDAASSLVQQAIRTKHAACPEACPLPLGCPHRGACNRTRVWTYRNSVKAQLWFPVVRKVLEDEAYSGFFLHYKSAQLPNGSIPGARQPNCAVEQGKRLCTNLYRDLDCNPAYPKPAYPDKKGWCSPPGCNYGGELPGGEYYFDFRNASLRAWYVSTYLGDGDGNGLRNANVDGFFLDDRWSSKGPTESPSELFQDIGLNATDVDDIYTGYTQAVAAAQRAIAKAGAYTWQSMANSATAATAPFVAVGSRNHNGHLNCSAYMRTACVPGNSISASPLFYGLDHDGDGRLPHLSFDLAAFLMVRGDFAWLGYSWMGCAERGCGAPPWPNSSNPARAPCDASSGRTRIDWEFPPELERDYGTPVGWGGKGHQGSGGGGYCTENSPGVFEREYTRAMVTLDCTAGTGSVVMKI
jgi:hypothetical protein